MTSNTFVLHDGSSEEKTAELHAFLDGVDWEGGPDGLEVDRPPLHVDVGETMVREGDVVSRLATVADAWRPIEELSDRYAGNLLLVAPELVDLDCNEHGVGMGYWQDGRDEPCDEKGACGDPNVDYGGFLACKWSMSNDEWREVPCTPTHFLVLAGPR